jgi:16S rRNA (adenine1518-N6/adenine1519-N6)-dimethyltransferase
MQHRAKKRFGQNFLVDENIIQKIISSINPQKNDTIIEIGPGLGALTKPMLNYVNSLNVIELDRDIIPKLLKNCQSQINVDNNTSTNLAEKLEIHQCDVLKFDFREFCTSRQINNDLRIIGNLPYNISTAVLFYLLKNRDIINDMFFMLQKEVVERISSPHGNKVYGRLSVMIQSYFKVTPLFTVPSHAFNPPPKVESAILQLEPYDLYSKDIKSHTSFETLIRSAFSHRRKTLSNNLKTLCTNDQILSADIDPAQRAEELSVADYVRLHQRIS